MIRTKNSQLSIEFILVVCAVLIIFLITFSMLNNRSNQYIYTSRSLDARHQIEKLSSWINTVFLAGEGTTYYAHLPLTLSDNTNYTINIYPEHHMVEVVWKSRKNLMQDSVQIVTANVTGNITDIKGNLTIKNIGGQIWIQ